MLLQGKRIFNVEDNPQNLAINRILLDMEGAHFFYERWGLNTAQRVVEVLPIDLIILDLQFPNNISGYTIFEELHNHAKLAHIPIIILSAFDTDERTMEAKNKGLRGYLRKPANPKIFVEKIKYVLDGGEIWNE